MLETFKGTVFLMINLVGLSFDAKNKESCLFDAFMPIGNICNELDAVSSLIRLPFEPL